MKKIFSILILTLVLVFNSNAEKLVMYVEYGGKGIKLGVLAYTDATYRHYKPV